MLHLYLGVIIVWLSLFLSFLDFQLIGAVFRQAMVVDGSYMLMSRLLAINSCISPLSHSSLALPQEVHTSLKACQWSKDLQGYPDKQFYSFIVQGITSGFRIDFDRSSPLQSATKNLHSSNPTEYLEWEALLQRSWKIPIPPSTSTSVQWEQSLKRTSLINGC